MSIPQGQPTPFLQNTITFSKDDQQFLIQLTALYGQIARYVNSKEIAIYNLAETITGQQWFVSGNPQLTRLTNRKVFQIGSIPTGNISITAHGITGFSTLTFTSIYGTAITDIVDQRPIPFASAAVVTNQIEIRVDATNITIVNGATAPNITSAIVVLEYLKN